MRRNLAAAVLVGFAIGAGAAETDATPQAPADRDGMLERSRGAVRGFTEGVAREVDSWFGDRPFENGGRVSGSFGFKFLVRQHDHPDATLRFGAKLDMPNVKEKTYLFFGQENEDELIRDQPEAFTRRELLLEENRRTDQTLFAGIGYALRDAIDLRAGLRSGLKPYAQARYKRNWLLTDQDSLNFRETVFWKPKDGFGSTTALSFGHGFSRSLAFRWQAAATITEETDGLAWSNSLGMFKGFGDDRVLSFEAIAGGNTSNSNNVSETGVRVIWKQPVYRDWTIMELSVGHFWPQGDAKDDNRRNWAMGLGIEIFF